MAKGKLIQKILNAKKKLKYIEIPEEFKNDYDAIRFASDRIQNDFEFMKEFEQVEQ